MWSHIWWPVLGHIAVKPRLKYSCLLSGHWALLEHLVFCRSHYVLEWLHYPIPNVDINIRVDFGSGKKRGSKTFLWQLRTPKLMNDAGHFVCMEVGTYYRSWKIYLSFVCYIFGSWKNVPVRKNLRRWTLLCMMSFIKASSKPDILIFCQRLTVSQDKRTLAEVFNLC